MTGFRVAERDEDGVGVRTRFGLFSRVTAAIAVLVFAGFLALALVGAIPAELLLIAIALVSGVALVTLAAVRFEVFILTLIVVRSSLDVLKTSASGSSVTDPASLVALLMIGASVAWLIAQRGSGPRRPLSPLSLGLALFALAAGVSVIGAAQMGPSIGVFLRVLSGILMFFVVGRLLAGGMPLKRLVLALAASTIVPVLLPLVGLPFGITFTRTKDGVEALASTFFLSNNFAHYLVPFLIVALALRGQVSDRRKRWVLTGFLAIGLVELTYTNTRGAWAALIVGAVIVGFVQHKGVLVGIIAATVLAIAFIPTINQRLADLGSNPDLPRTESSWSWRVGQWETIIPLANENPVTGIGIGMTAVVTPNHKQPHNDYVRAYVEMGLFGLAAYLLSVVGFVWVSHRSRRRARTAFETALTLGIFAYSVAFAVSSVAENLITGVGWLWYAMPLAAIANWIAYRHEPPTNPQPIVSAAPESAGER